MSEYQRQIGLTGAVGIGVGAIVGGGILALAGAAFAATGPSAVVAFALNGVIALLTALSFAEMSAAFPESGGTYVFSKKVLSIRAAFGVGWIIWFASIVAAVLYALGAGFFIAKGLKHIWFTYSGQNLEWITAELTTTVIALIATLFYTASLIRKQASGGVASNIGKVLVFAVLLAAGTWFLINKPVSVIEEEFTPFFAFGAFGLIQAMGYTFIALQGFDLIAAVAGEVKEPSKTIPRAMIISLCIALAIYLPFLLILTVAGPGPGEDITQASAAQPEGIVVIAARNYLGQFGFWLVIAAGVLSMLTALYANILAASRIAFSMARDRALPHQIGSTSKKSGATVTAVLVTALVVLLTVIVIPDVTAAGAAASLVFLISFAIAHWIGYLSRKRTKSPLTFKTPLFPLVPVIGIVCCVSLAVFQGIVVPIAGIIVLVWLLIGGVLYINLFAKRARVVDASAEGYDPHLVSLRGKSPLVLVPVANPENARSMVGIASAIAPPVTGRVLLLNVVKTTDDTEGEGLLAARLANSQRVLAEALKSSVDIGLKPEALVTLSEDPFEEIVRVSKTHACESMLLGFANLEDEASESQIEYIINEVDCDVVIERTKKDIYLKDIKKILVPVAGGGTQGELLARLLGSLTRAGQLEVTFLRVIPESSDWKLTDRARLGLFQFGSDMLPKGQFVVKLLKSDDVTGTIAEAATETDLVILGLQRFGRRRKAFGELAIRIARDTDVPILMISRGR